MHRTSWQIFIVAVPLLWGCLGEVVLSDPPAAALNGHPDVRCAKAASEPVGLQRLTTRQTALTLTELTGVDTPIPESFPRDDLSGGYITVPLAQLMSTEFVDRQMEWALAAAQAVVRQRAPKVISCDVATSSTCVAQILERFLPRALRRPPLASETKSFSDLYANAPGQPEDKLTTMLAAIFMAPQFLYRELDEATPTQSQALSGHAIASRLSYFLWDSMPDDLLFAKAADNSLTQPEVIEAEVLRMLASPKSDHLARAIADQWMGLSRLQTHTLSTTAFPTYDDATRSAMYAESVAFIKHLLQSNAPLSDLLTARYSFVNDRLASLYGLTGSYSATLVRADLSSTGRRGILGHASILSLTSSGEKTSIIKRGLWVNEKILCTHISDPPVDLDLSPPKDLPPDTTPRELAAAHRSKASCAACHNFIDPPGLILERLDPLGRERATYIQKPLEQIDTTTVLPDGTPVRDVSEFVDIVTSSPQFAACVTERIMPIALGRFSSSEDRCALEAISEEGSASQQTLPHLIQNLTKSALFRTKGSETSL